jgi:pimeloyl-ACP methyl ester carboxylesterase
MNDSSNKIHLHYAARGEGPPVILLHGIAASLHDWDNLSPAMAAAGYRTFAVDLPGHGESEKPDDAGQYTAQNVYDIVEDWIAHLKEPPPYYLVGHSFGAHLSLRYTLHHPGKVRALALIDPFYKPGQVPWLLRILNRRPTLGSRAMQHVPLGVIDAVLGWDPIRAEFFSPEARWQIATDYKRASPHILHIARTASDLTPQLKDVRQPCMVLWGEKDLTLAPASFPKLVSILPEATGQAIPGCGHQPHIGKPHLVNRLVLEHFDRAAEAAAINLGEPAG